MCDALPTHCEVICLKFTVGMGYGVVFSDFQVVRPNAVEIITRRSESNTLEALNK